MSYSDKIVDRQTRTLSRWVTLVTRSLEGEGGRMEQYHSLRQSDYVTVLAETSRGEVLVVRQFRPALEKYTVELPGGLHEGDDEPVVTAARELQEETGFRAKTPPVLLGCLDPDSGRLENRFWCFYTNDIELLPDWRPEPGIERISMSRERLLASVQTGEFSAALHIAIMALAMIRLGWGPSQAR